LSSREQGPTIYTERACGAEISTYGPYWNSLVILPTVHYENKIEQFIQSNNFLTSKTNPIDSFQTQVRKVINNSKALIPSGAKWKNISLNPSAPSIKG